MKTNPTPEFGGVLADWQIEERIALPPADRYRLTIDPFFEGDSPKGQISYGLSSYGYDLRLGRNFRVFNDTAAVLIDPKNMDLSKFTAYDDVDHCIIPPNSFALAESLEVVRIPVDCLGEVKGKSTYARCSIHLTMTPIEPEWEGVITLEISNSSRLPAKVYAGEGIGQLVLFKGDAVCKRSYAQKKNSKYQGQTGLTGPRV